MPCFSEEHRGKSQTPHLAGRRALRSIGELHAAAQILLLLLAPLINLIFAFAIFRFSCSAYPIYPLLALSSLAKSFDSTEFPVEKLEQILFAIGALLLLLSIVLSYYLWRKLFPDSGWFNKPRRDASGNFQFSQ